MADSQKTVFISYRRSTSWATARAIFMDLRANGYDAFMDVASIDSGTFDTVILNQIAARAHFLVILEPGTLERCAAPDDWLRREIEYAMDLGRNIVPVMVESFRFDDQTHQYLTSKLNELPRYNGLHLYHDYFEDGMRKLRDRFLKQPVYGPINPTPRKEEAVVQQKIEAVVVDNLLRGVVPDHRIPFDARVAYNRANSLVRAGKYDEAERLYREARDLAARAGIASWKDVEQALLDIQDLALARELLTEGDRSLAADDWDGALQKYEGALRVVPNDPLAQDRIDMVRNVRQQFDQATVQLHMIRGPLGERGEELLLLLNMLASLRQMFPRSERLKRLVREVEDRLNNVIAQLYSKAQGELTRADMAAVLEVRLSLTSEAIRALQTAAELAPADEDINNLLQRAFKNREKLLYELGHS